MKPAIRDKVLAAMDKAASTAGADRFDRAAGRTCATLETLVELGGKMRTRESAIQCLDDAQLSRRHEVLLLAAVNMLPMIIGYVFRKLGDTASEFPALPAGRSSKLTYEQELAVIDLIARLHKQGVDLGACKYRASKEFGTKFRTIERAWNNRAILLADGGPEPDFHEVIKCLTE